MFWSLDFWITLNRCFWVSYLVGSGCFCQELVTSACNNSFACSGIVTCPRSTSRTEMELSLRKQYSVALTCTFETCCDHWLWGNPKESRHRSVSVWVSRFPSALRLSKKTLVFNKFSFWLGRLTCIFSSPWSMWPGVWNVIWMAFLAGRSISSPFLPVFWVRDPEFSLDAGCWSMEAVHRHSAVVQSLGLFKAASARQVLWDVAQLAVSGVCGSPSSPYESLQHVSCVDVFISHNWSCPSALKYLTLCHYLNLDLALISSSATAIVTAFILILRAGSLTGVAQEGVALLCGALIHGPMFVFLLAYLVGHQVFARQSFWFDRICVDQSDMAVKEQTLQAIPAFVAQSKQMLILWDSTYFERLWCLYEIAVSAKTSTSSSQKEQFVPTWAPLGTLFCLGLFFLGSLALGETESMILDKTSRWSLFKSFFSGNFPPIYLEFLMAVFLSYVCFQKLQRHEWMLTQMSSFDIRKARCSVEGDREVIFHQVCKLFAEEPLITVTLNDVMETETLSMMEDFEDDEILNNFNIYVRGPLRESLLQSTGGAGELPFKLCLVILLPCEFLGLVFVLGCDGHLCELSASYAGYSSVSHYFLTNSLNNLVIGPIFTAITFPVMLRTNHWVSGLVSNFHLRWLVGSICCTLMQFCMDVLFCCLCGLTVVVSTKFSTLWLAALIFGFTLWLSLLFCLFKKQIKSPRQRSLQRVSSIYF